MHSFMTEYKHNIVKNIIFQWNKINIDLQKKKCLKNNNIITSFHLSITNFIPKIHLVFVNN